jgi:5-methylcytosine-specific restriction endonuclease McrA
VAKAKRPPIPLSVQAAVLFRDRWLCYLCKRPVIFHFALKRLGALAKEAYPDLATAYWHPNWRRDAAPLLDELAASIDHVTAYAKAGAHEASNFATICARCNARKSAKDVAAFRSELKAWKVKGTHGEPGAWDGFASLFVILASRDTVSLTATERGWLRVLKPHLNDGGSV